MEINKDYIRKVFGGVEWESALITNSVESVSRDNKELGIPVHNSITKSIIRLILPDKRVGYSVLTNPLKWSDCFVKAFESAKASRPRTITPSISPMINFSKNLLNFKNFNENFMLLKQFLCFLNNCNSAMILIVWRIWLIQLLLLRNLYTCIHHSNL